jgi:exosortase/archaeosortase family protein
MVAIFALSTIYGFLTFEHNWKRVLMMLVSFPLAVICNVTRMLCIILAAEISGQHAGDFVHENWFFSLVPYVPAFIGVYFMARWLGETGKAPSAATPGNAPSTATPKSA